MDVAGPRERRRSRTRNEILGAALDLFEAKGYEDTTIEEIADAADISPRTFFRYFDGKLDLVIDHAKEQTAPTLDELLTARPPSEPPLTAVRNVLRTKLVEELRSDDHKLRQFRVALSTPSVRPAVREHFFQHQEDVADTFAARFGDTGDDLRARVTALAAVGAAWTAFEQWVDDGGDVDALASRIDEAFALLRQGLD